MSETGADGAFELAQRALLVALWVALPVLGAALSAGLLVSAAQAATRQSDATVSTVPKLLAAGGAVLVFGAWMAAVLGGFWVELWTHLPEMVR
ncbi:MAG TPA: flagellar biosynthetic protein FliQ [Armatimonadota bacterium]|nr:flagellar biosynthetic protein FliQ [Armatimonadota bacterium]